jgi:hypothetical protein
MKNIDDGRKIHSAMNVTRELSISPKTFVDTALKLKAFLLLKTPENTEIYLRDSYKKILVNRWGNWGQVLDFNRNERTIAVTLNTSYLCLAPSEYDPIVPMGQIQIKEFKAIAKLEANYEITILDVATYLSLYSETAFEGTFDSFHKEKQDPLMPPGSPNKERVLTVEFADLLITPEDLRAIRKELSRKRPSYGMFQPEEWTSRKLAELNEASTHFLSSGLIDIETSELRNEIKNWLEDKWKEGGKDLVEQAANAILPDHLYDSSPHRETVDDLLRSAYNSYASTALILINEKARKCWEEMQSSTHRKFPKRDNIKTEMKKDYRFSAKLVDAVATIIRPDAK